MPTTASVGPLNTGAQNPISASHRGGRNSVILESSSAGTDDAVARSWTRAEEPGLKPAAVLWGVGIQRRDLPALSTACLQLH